MRARQGGKQPAGTAGKQAAAPPPGNAALGLQRLVGNRLAREVGTTAGDLKGLQRGGKSSSSFAKLRAALKRYEKATGAQKGVQLERLNALCIEWLNEHRTSDDALDKRRRPYVTKLLDEIAIEQVSLSKAQAQDVYMAGARSHTDPHALKAISQASRDAANQGHLDKAGKELAKAKGLTPAEIAAIQIFTAEDYTYINPATANSKGWLDANKGKHGLAQPDKVLKEEGALHTGIAMQGLVKLDEYQGTVFRGQSFSEQEWKAFLKEGVYRVSSFASASREQYVAETFAESSTGGKSDKTIAVVFEIRKSGGRDVSKISLAGGEKEVTLLPGSGYPVKQYAKIAPPHKFKDNKQIKQWYKVVVAPAEKELPELPDDL